MKEKVKEGQLMVHTTEAKHKTRILENAPNKSANFER